MNPSLFTYRDTGKLIAAGLTFRLPFARRFYIYMRLPRMGYSFKFSTGWHDARKWVVFV
jgi:hypothetical protein